MAATSVRSFDSGDRFTANQMTQRVKHLVADWHVDVVSIGYAGPVRAGRLVQESAPRWKGMGNATASEL